MKKISFRVSIFVIAFCFFVNPGQAQIVGANAFLQGQYLEIGMNDNGSYGASTSPANYHSHLTGATFTPGGALAEVYDYGHDGWTVGSPAFAGDFTYPGLPFEGWELQVGTARSQAAATAAGFTTGGGGIGLSGSIVGYSSVGGNKMVSWAGSALGGQLLIDKTTRLDTLASWVITTVQLRNTGATPLSNVYYTRMSDADIDQTWGGGFSTSNWITYQNDTAHRVLTTTAGMTTPGYMSLAATDSRARAYLFSAWPLSTAVDLATIYAMTFTPAVYTAGAHMDGDNGMGIVFNLGTINAGDSTTFSYAYVFSDSTAVDSVQTTLCGGPLVAGTAVADEDTACPTTTVNFALVGASAYTATVYQWQSSSDSVTWTNISGAVSAMYSFTGLAASTYYRCVVSCSESGVSVFTPGVLVVFTPVCPCAGMTTGVVTTNVTAACVTTSVTLDATGYTLTGVTYQWQSSADSATWSDVAGATTVPYTFTGLTATTYYRLVVTCIASGASVFSAGVAVTFLPTCPCAGLTAGTASSNVTTACPTTSITLSNVGYLSTGVTLQWQSSSDSTTWSDISGATTVPYSFTGLGATTYYRLEVTCIASGTTAVSAGVKVDFTASCACTPFSAGTVYSSVSAACFTTVVIINNTGYTASGTTLQWQASTDSMTWVDIPVTTVPYTMTNLMVTTYYRLKVTCILSGTSVYSAGKKITYYTCPPSPTEVSNVSGNKEILIYPNPAAGELNIEFSKGAFSSFMITNTVGQHMVEDVLNNEKTTVSLKTLPAGVYYITLSGDGGSEVRKFVKM
jgi:hypothetical protein